MMLKTFARVKDNFKQLLHISQDHDKLLVDMNESSYAIGLWFDARAISL